jgi:signal transducing adaptor molecule
MPEPTAAEIAKEAEHEAAVFAQAANVDRLLTMLRSWDSAKDNLADNEEIQVRQTSSCPCSPTNLLTGTLPELYERTPEDSQVDR